MRRVPVKERPMKRFRLVIVVSLLANLAGAAALFLRTRR
jgi:hypothetical protein